MGFRTGFLLGLLIGATWALLFAPSRGEEARKRLRTALAGQEEEEGQKPPAEGEPMARLRQALKAMRRQLQEAWEEAQKAVQEAEKEMRERYQASLRQGPRRSRGP